MKKYCLLFVIVSLSVNGAELSSVSSLKRDYNLENAKEVRFQHCDFLHTKANAKVAELAKTCHPETIAAFNLSGEPTELTFSSTPLKAARLKVIYLYNSENKLIETKTYEVYNQQTRLIDVCKVSYENSGKQKLEQCYGNNETLSLRGTTDFDNNGDPVVVVIDFIKNEKHRVEGKFINHQEVETTIYLNGKITNKVHNSYDKKGDLKTKKEIEYPSKQEITQTFQYQYNAKGDWIEQVTYELDKPIKFIRRKITYYE